MTDPTNDIDALLRRIDPRCEFCGFIAVVDCARYHAALTALVAERNALQEENIALRSRQKSHQDEVLDRVFEMDALRKRIAELEAHPPAASDLRERLLESALRGVSLSGYDKRGSESLGRAAVWMVDAAIAAMRKGEA